MLFVCVFLFNDTATTEIYTYCHTLSLHDALPISEPVPRTADAPGHAGQPLGVRRPLQHRGLVQALSVCCFVQERLQPRSAGESQPGRGAKRSPYFACSACRRCSTVSTPVSRMYWIGPPRNGAKPVPKITPASSRSASSTTPSCSAATASLSSGSTSRSSRSPGTL